MALWSLGVGTGPPWPWRGTAPAPQPRCLPTPTVSQRRCSSPAHAASSSFPACFWGILTLQHPCRQRQQDGYPGGHVLGLSLLPARWRRVRRAGGSPSARPRLRASCWQGDPGITKPRCVPREGDVGTCPLPHTVLLSPSLLCPTAPLAPLPVGPIPSVPSPVGPHCTLTPHLLPHCPPQLPSSSLPPQLQHRPRPPPPTQPCCLSAAICLSLLISINF